MNLYLSGSGGRTSVAIGLISQLDYAKFNKVYAVSGSALAAFFVLSKKKDTFDEVIMKDVTKYTAQRWISFSDIANLLYYPFFKPSFLTLDNLTKLLKELEVPKENDLAKLTICVFNVNDSKLEWINGDHPNFIDYLLATISIPSYYPPVLIDGKYYTDPIMKNHLAFDESTLAETENQMNIFVNFGDGPARMDGYTNNLSNQALTTLYSTELIIHRERIKILQKYSNQNLYLYVMDLHPHNKMKTITTPFGRNIETWVINDEIKDFTQKVPIDNLPRNIIDLADPVKGANGLAFGNLIGKSITKIL
jgi:predicted acylesterase/phospholipase RssA